MPQKHSAKRRNEAGDLLRSPCPVACALDMLGDRWTLLVIRDLMMGRSRFKDFTASPEGIPTNILSERLSRLLRQGLAEQVPAEDGSQRWGYRLTEKGLALRPVLVALRDWGLHWEPGTEALMESRESRRLGG
jgi:DNA-binding HxlR family transcriptional regulator